MPTPKNNTTESRFTYASKSYMPDSFSIENNKVTKSYKRGIVTFIDILGFKSLVENGNESEIYDSLSLFKKSYAQGSQWVVTLADALSETSLYNVKSPSLETVYFSDSIVRIQYPLDFFPEQPEVCDIDALSQEIKMLSNIQEHLLCKGIIVRGGMTIGDICYDNESKILFGPAMNRAYKLESQLAQTPRIIIDPEILLHNEELTMHRYELGILRNEGFLRKDKDNIEFIDYFGEASKHLFYGLYTGSDKNERFPFPWTEWGKKVGIYANYSRLFDRREIITRNILKYQEHENVLMKYLWMAKQHNATVNNIYPHYKKFAEVSDLCLDNEQSLLINAE